MAFEVVSRIEGEPEQELGILRPTLPEALLLAGADDEVWQVADDENLTRVRLILPRGGVKPGMRQVAGEWRYSAAWL